MEYVMKWYHGANPMHIPRPGTLPTIESARPSLYDEKGLDERFVEAMYEECDRPHGFDPRALYLGA